MAVFIIILVFIALTCTLTWYLLSHDHGRKLPIGSLWTAFGFGVLAMVIAGVLEALLLPKTLTTNPHSLSAGMLLASFLGVGIIEESAKFLPLALFIYRRPYFKEHTDGTIYFAISGLTFGLFENILYTMSDGAGTGIERLLTTPFFHAAVTSVLGYYLVSYKIDHRKRNKLILACVLVPLTHGLYDFGLSSGIFQFQVVSLMISLLCTMGLFLYFTYANRLDRAALAAIPIRLPANFCSRCGKANARHTKFCESCGQPL